MGETVRVGRSWLTSRAFSILKRIVMGETLWFENVLSPLAAFSILKRIVMGETRR